MTKANIKRLFAIVIAIAMSIAAMCLVACNDKPNGDYVPPPDDGTGVKAIRITENPRTEYAEGEVFSTAGMVIVADWYGDDEPDVLWTGEYTYTHKGELLTRDVTEIVFSYEGASVSLPITVTPRDVTGIEILNAPETLSMNKGIDLSKLEVKTVCSDGEGWIIGTEDYILDEITPYSKNIKITYKLGSVEYVAEKPIEVVAEIFAAGAVQESEAKEPGDNSDYVMMNNGETTISPSGGAQACRIRAANGTNCDITFVVWSEYSDCSVALTLSAANAKVRGDNPNYFLEDLKFHENFNMHVNGTEEKLPEDLILPGKQHFESFEDIFNFVQLDLGTYTLKKGYNTIKISNRTTDKNNGWIVLNVDRLIIKRTDAHFGDWIVDKENSCTENGKKHRICAECGEHEEQILTASHALTGISIATPPTKVNYHIGEAFDKHGMSVKANCSQCDGYILSDDDYTLPENVFDSSITVSYEYSGKTYTCAQVLRIPVVIEAELAKPAAPEQPDNQNYVVANIGSKLTNGGNTQSGGGYLGSINTSNGNPAGKYVSFFVYSQSACTAEIFLRAATGRRSAGNMVQMDLSEWLTLTVNDIEKSMASTGVLPGCTGENWFNWATVSLGNFDLQAGYNEIRLTIRKDGINMNMDCLEVIFDA